MLRWIEEVNFNTKLSTAFKYVLASWYRRVIREAVKLGNTDFPTATYLVPGISVVHAIRVAQTSVLKLWLRGRRPGFCCATALMSIGCPSRHEGFGSKTSVPRFLWRY